MITLGGDCRAVITLSSAVGMFLGWVSYASARCNAESDETQYKVVEMVHAQSISPSLVKDPRLAQLSYLFYFGKLPSGLYTHTHTHTHRNGVGGKKTHTHTPGISADFGPALVVFPLFHLPVIVPLPG